MDITGLCRVLGSISALFDKLLVTENQKLDAIAVNDIEKLDEYMRAEQAFTMELRGLDAKREAIQEELGFGGYTLSKIIEWLAPADAEHMRAVTKELRDKTDELSMAVSCTRKFIELHLRSLDFVLAGMGEEREQASSYEAGGSLRELEGRPTQFVPKKV